MKQITILPEDFNSVTPLNINGSLTLEFKRLYVEPNDCPIARAVKRATGSDDVGVTCFNIRVDDNRYQYPKGKAIGIDKLAKVCTIALKNGKAMLRLNIDIPVNE